MLCPLYMAFLLFGMSAIGKFHCIPIIIIIMVNLSLIINNNVIKSLEMTSYSKLRTNRKYREH